MSTFIAEIENYRVSTYRSARRSPREIGRTYSRILQFSIAEGSYGNGLRMATLYFINQGRAFYDASYENHCGLRRSETVLEGYLPLEDYADIYDIVKSEKPVYILWNQDDGLYANLIQVMTFDEPLGEGPSELIP